LESDQKSGYIADIGQSEARAHKFEHQARRILSDLG
jgi:hypothetical protein